MWTEGREGGCLAPGVRDKARGRAVELLVLIWIVCGFGAGVIASSHGRGGCAWFAIGFLLGPIGLGSAFLIPDDGQSSLAKPSRADRAALQDGKARKCPSCLSIVPNEARKCRYCASNLPPPPRRDIWGREVGPG
jgi:hypothetical protein